MNEREYIVTLHNYEDLDGFYEDMETPGGNLYIPNRAVPVFKRRNISRNTHYMLTDEEAETVSLDPRVLSVQLTPEELGVVIIPLWEQTSSFWNKSSSLASNHLNWALLRCYEGSTRSNWGDNGITNVSGTARGSSTGKNVDVVIVDGHLDPSHPEFAVNPVGTGGSRVVQYNWLQHNSELGLGANGTYVYTPYVSETASITDNNNHGAHVAGIAAGNTQGWAKDANIYNISPYQGYPASQYFIDYLRAWHKSKPINLLTGRRNPTISNHSYATMISAPISSITAIRYRGTLINGPFTGNQLEGYKLRVVGENVLIQYNDLSDWADRFDAANEGIIFVGAAGNNSDYVIESSNDSNNDYNNLVYIGLSSFYYCRGSISAAPGTICVGNISTSVDERKESSSSAGSRIDIWAPGESIISSVNSSIGVQDSRNSNYRNVKFTGTSMSSPQVCGVLACILEINPRMTYQQAKEYIVQNSTKNQITDIPSDSRYDLKGSYNRFLFAKQERNSTGSTSPKLNLGLRPTNGSLWPRTKIYRYGNKPVTYITKTLALQSNGKTSYFYWPNAIDQPLNTLIYSVPMKITDVPVSTTIYPTRNTARLSVNNGPFTRDPQPINSGDIVVVELRSSSIVYAAIGTQVIFTDPVYGARALASFSVKTINETRAPQVFQVGENRTIKTLNELVTTLTAGDIVELDPGTYPPVLLQRGGTEEKPIIIRGNNSIFSGGVVTFELKGSHNVILDNIEITGASAAGLRTSAHNIVLQNSKVYGCPRHGILGLDNGGGNFTIKNCEIYNVGLVDPAEAFCHAVYVAVDGEQYPNTKLRLEHNYIHSYKGNGVKSRAPTELYYNWIDGQNNPETLYNIELIGYQAYFFHTFMLNSDVVGNVFISNNPYCVRVGGDGSGTSRGRVRMAHNSFIFNSGFAVTQPVIRLAQKLDGVYLINNTFERGDNSGVGFRMFRDDISSAGVWISGRIKLAGTTNLIPSNVVFGVSNELVNNVTTQTTSSNLTTQLLDYRIETPLTQLNFVASSSTAVISRTITKLGALE